MEFATKNSSQGFDPSVRMSKIDKQKKNNWKYLHKKQQTKHNDLFTQNSCLISLFCSFHQNSHYHYQTDKTKKVH